MYNTRTSLSDSGCRLIHITRIDDERGSLCVAQEGCDIPFPIKRIFWISGVGAGQTRGGHANWQCDEVVFAVNGSFSITVDNGNEARTYRICDRETGIVIPRGVWCLLSDFAPATVCCCVASADYCSDDYVHDYDDYLRQLPQHRL